MEKGLNPEHRRMYRRLLVDEGHYVWVELFHPSHGVGNPAWESPDPDLVPRWEVFAPDGEALGRIETPAGLFIDQIGSDFLLGVQRDDLDVEHVRMYRLIR